jgi:hypothetical protein
MTMRRELYQNGKLIAVQDSRTVASSAELALILIKQHCREAIEATGISWMIERELSGGKAVPEEVKQKCVFFRDKSNEMEALIADAVTKETADLALNVCDEIESYVALYAMEIESAKL